GAHRRHRLGDPASPAPAPVGGDARPPPPPPSPPVVRPRTAPDLLRLLFRKRPAGCAWPHPLRPRARPRGGPGGGGGPHVDGDRRPAPGCRLAGACALAAPAARRTRLPVGFSA